jgi:hypothetical protein
MSLSTAPILTAPRTPVNVVLRDFGALVCAGGAGVHAALVPEHLKESVPLGAGFAGFAAAVLTAAAIAYLLSRTSGIPLLITEPEQFDPLGLLTTTAELAGALSYCPPLITRKDQS